MAKEETQSEPPTQVIEGETPSSAELLFEQHQKSIIAGVTIFVVAVFGYIVVSHLNKGKQEQAALAFSDAVTIADYAAVTSEHGGTVAAGNALLMKADLEFAEDKLDESKATLEKFTSAYTSHPLYLQGILALGVQEETRGNLDEAQSYYQQVIDAENAPEIAPLALIRKGDVLYARGDFQGARSIYQSVEPTYPGTPFSYKVREKLNREKLRGLPAPAAAATPATQTGAAIPVVPGATPGAPATAVPVTVTPMPAPATATAPAPATTTPAPAATTKPVQIPAAPEKPKADDQPKPAGKPKAAADKLKPVTDKPKADKPKAATDKLKPAEESP